MLPISRRQFLAAGAPFALMAMSGPLARAEQVRPRFGPAQPFSFDWLRQQAKELAQRPYVPPEPPAPETVAKIEFDAVQKIRFRPDRALWPSGPGRLPVRLFHLDKFNALPVRINELSGGMAREVVYSKQDFDYKTPAMRRMLPGNLGYSGFRVMDGHGKDTDWLAFQGASYFRSSGEENQYGASARGIAVDTAMPTPEEFPRFVEFWLAEPKRDSPSITIFALLDGPSVTGAYRFKATKEHGAIMDVTAELFARTDIARLGFAPLTSMFWYGANDRRFATDWRPEIHDSDGLAMWTGSGEHIWRPLIDPPSVRTNSFLDDNPKGFGLMQRDRAFASYQDDGAFYNRRPSIWVEPIGNWGKGAVQLVEIPTQDEIHDNIVAYWLPAKPVKSGDHLEISYRLHWRNDEPHPPANLGRVVATRTGAGGVPGRPLADDKTKRKFVIDFEGGPLEGMAPRFDVTPVVTTSHGTVDNAYVIKVVGTDKWRALFDLTTDGKEPVDLRCFLRLGEDTLSETWIYQYLPAA
jgi:periplasmic glucans biosynthesis protein